MKRIILIIFFLALSVTVASIGDTHGAVMSDYCQIPPYVVENMRPNIMLILDNSGSMFNFAYYDGYATETTADDNLCANVNNPCTDFQPGTYGDGPDDPDPYNAYYGYFDPNWWYEYTNNRFEPMAHKNTRAKDPNEWDGNFLNWLTMRRLDVVRKALTGGKKGTGAGSGFSMLESEKPDCDDRGQFKQISNASQYANISDNETRCFQVKTAGGTCLGGGSGTAAFDISTGTSCTSSFLGDYTITMKVPDPVEGVLQEVVSDKARVGLSYYNDNNPDSDGGFVRMTIGGSSLSSLVNEVNINRPRTNTPLAEMLWTMVGYFAQVNTLEGGPGPLYKSGDYQINDNVDPFNFGKDTPAHCVSSNYIVFVTDGEPCADGRLPATMKNYASGKSNYDCFDLIPGNPGSNGFCPAVGPFPTSTAPWCAGGLDPGGAGNVTGFEDVALYAHTTDLRSSTHGKDDLRGNQNLTLYTIFAFGKASSLIKYATINGSFEDSNANNVPDLQSEWDADLDGKPDNFEEAENGEQIEDALRAVFENILKKAASGTAASVLASGEGEGANLVQAVFYPRTQQTGEGGIFGQSINWVGRLSNYWFYVDPFFTLSSMREEEKTTKDNMLDLTDDDIASLFYDNSQKLTMASRCSDTDGDNVCNGTTENFNFEKLGSVWEAGLKLWEMDSTARTLKTWDDADNDGTVDAAEFTGFTVANVADFFVGSSDTSITKNLFNLSAADDDLDGFLDDDMNRDGVLNATDAEILIEYVQGKDFTALYPWLRTKKTTIDLNENGQIDAAESTGKIWKLGDILSSTPRVSGWQQLNSYDSRYKDATYAKYISSAAYVDRGTVFTGANDGMLHAFKLGKVEFPSNPDQCSFTNSKQKACLSGANLGSELWSYVPRNALPYLKYMKEPTYCHIYTADLSPFIFDASIGPKSAGDISDSLKTGDTNTWRTIVIGGFRTGGACKNTGTACTEDVNMDGKIDDLDCVKTPISNLGYSAYFAIDITDPLNPELLWEFAHEDLGYSTTGPAVVKISAKNDANGNSVQEGDEPPDNDKNGKWFVVLGSGTTGPINTTYHQFYGNSDQNLKLFVIDLKTGALASGSPIDTGIQKAFAGSMLNATHDTDLDYQDDVLYIPYTRSCESGDSDCDKDTWTRGGILRLVTNEELNPSNWEAPNIVIEDLGPAVSAVKRLQDTEKDQMWLYTGTGRYYYKIFDDLDDKEGLRQFMGMKDICYDPNNASANHQGFLTGADCSALTFCTEPCTNPGTGNPCTSPKSAGITGDCGDLENVTDITNVTTTPDDPAYKGWYINFDPAGDYKYFFTDFAVDPPVEKALTSNFGAERVITDPVATPLGVVFYGSFKPYADDCELGGKTFIWATKYNTGGSVASLLQGIALIQVSTGAIEQLDLSDAFTENPDPGDADHDPDRPVNEDSKGDRRSGALEGVPPTGQGISIISSPPPLERTIHIREY